MSRDEQRRRSNRLGPVPLQGLVAVALAALAGCHGSGPNPATQPAPNYQVIKRARPPMSVVVIAGGHFQLVDLADDQNQRVDRLVFDTKVGPNSVITLNTTGLTINAQPTAAKGPFSRKHTYEFRLLK